MRASSGRVDDFRPVVTFLYELARDHIPTGVLENLIDHAVKAAEPNDEGERGPTMFTNGWLARWAQYVANRFEDAVYDDEAPPPPGLRPRDRNGATDG